MTGGKPWWDQAFGQNYDLVYQHRDDASALLEVSFVLQQIREFTQEEFSPRQIALDLACGAGRHLRALKSSFHMVFGLDYSPCLLTKAKAQNSPPLIRGDMRQLPFASGTFDIITQFFTAFGYFSNPDDDQRVLAEVARTLKLGGWHMLDLPNPAHVRATLVPLSERRLAEGVIREQRWIDESHVKKQVTICDHNLNQIDEWTESVRLYSKQEIKALYSQTALRIQTTRSRFDSVEQGDGSRLILFAQKIDS